MLEQICKVANYTHFSLEEITSMSVSELNQILALIEKEQHNQASIQLAIIDYHILLAREFDKKNQSQANKCQKQAQKIRGILTGVKPKKSNPLAMFQMFGIYTQKKVID